MSRVAPAESSDDDDGGGDEDPDPERQKVALRKSKKSKNTPEVRNGLPSDGFVRLPQVLAVFPVSKSSWWAGCKSGRYPKPTKLGPRTTAWKVEDIRALIASA
jgi:predicted DNA-binding transcriptional regulator AlpA